MKGSALLFLALGSVPHAALATPEDPVAYGCYFCTTDEMQRTAIQKGVGEHYVYDQSQNALIGFRVVQQQAGLIATSFAPAGWIRTQFNAMMNAYDPDAAAFVHEVRDVALLPPGTAHARSDAYLWGHHTSALHPLHVAARETARRFIEQRVQLDYLKADVEHGRLLRFESRQSDTPPIIVRLRMKDWLLGTIDYFHDRDSKRWEYLRAMDVREPIQESAEDFVGPTGRRTYFYSKYHYRIPDYFVQRAHLAGVRLRGETPPYNDLGIVCQIEAGEKVCTLTW